MGIFQKLGQLEYFQKLDGFDENVAIEFTMQMKRVNDEECITKVKWVSISLNEDFLSTVIGIPKGKKWDEDK